MRPVPAALCVASALVMAAALLAGTAGAAAAGPRDDLTVTADGVSFNPSRADDDRDVVYLVREQEGPRVEWLRADLDDARSGFVAFDEAAREMPEGYCVTYVRVPGVGEWSERSGGSVCTPERSSPSPSATVPAVASPTPTASPEPTPSAGVSPSPRASASPSPSPSMSPSVSPSMTPSPSPSPSAPVTAPSDDPLLRQGEALRQSFSGDLPELTIGGQDEGDPGRGRGWVAVGLILAAVTTTSAGALVWWGRRREH